MGNDSDPSTAPPRKLPFKRTVKRKSSEDAPKDTRTEDDGLELFKRSREFFPSVIDDQKKEAAEKAAKAEQERQDAITAEERRKREEVEQWASKAGQASQSESQDGNTPKRRRTGSDWDSDEERKPSRNDLKSLPLSRPSSSRKGQGVSASPHGKQSASRGSSFAARSKNPVVSIDDSDDDKDGDYQPPRSRSKRELTETPTKSTRERPLSEEPEVILDDSPPPQEPISDEFDIYVKRAMERAQKEKEARLASGSSSQNASARQSRAPVVEVLIASRDDALKPTSFKVRTDQRLHIMFETWVARQSGKQPELPGPMLANMVFTWKGNKVWTNTTLATLGIKPDAEGRLYNILDGKSDGFDRGNGQDKVFIEAWTPEQYEHFERIREYERMKALGEIDDDFGPVGSSFTITAAGASQQNSGSRDDGVGGQQGRDEDDDEKRVRIIMKPKQLPTQTVKVRPSTDIAMLIKVFCKMSNVPRDTKIEIHWDGEVLDPETTVEDADIGEMDSVEVHIKS